MNYKKNKIQISKNYLFLQVENFIEKKRFNLQKLKIFQNFEKSGLN